MEAVIAVHVVSRGIDSADLIFHEAADELTFWGWPSTGLCSSGESVRTKRGSR